MGIGMANTGVYAPEEKRKLRLLVPIGRFHQGRKKIVNIRTKRDTGDEQGKKYNNLNKVCSLLLGRLCCCAGGSY